MSGRGQGRSLSSVRVTSRDGRGGREGRDERDGRVTLRDGRAMVARWSRGSRALTYIYSGLANSIR